VNLTELIWEPLRAVLGAVAVWAASAASRWVLAKFTRSAAVGYLRIVVPGSISVIAALAYWRAGWPRPEVFALFAALIVLAFAVWELTSFWRAGLQGADPSIAKGLDYAKSLDLCHNELWLLGTGAAKLTREVKHLEPALRRCSRIEGGTIRFLLARPGSEFLGSAARQAGEPHDRYRQRVGESLRVLARLLRDGVNLEVRFYPAEAFVPLFRLIFIDNRLCLASYNVFGHGDGSELPQIRVARNDARNYASFYDPFRRYFLALWNSADPWNPEEFFSP